MRIFVIGGFWCVNVGTYLGNGYTIGHDGFFVENSRKLKVVGQKKKRMERAR